MPAGHRRLVLLTDEVRRGSHHEGHRVVGQVTHVPGVAQDAAVSQVADRVDRVVGRDDRCAEPVVEPRGVVVLTTPGAELRGCGRLAPLGHRSHPLPVWSIRYLRAPTVCRGSSSVGGRRARPTGSLVRGLVDDPVGEQFGQPAAGLGPGGGPVVDRPSDRSGVGQRGHEPLEVVDGRHRFAGVR